MHLRTSVKRCDSAKLENGQKEQTWKGVYVRRETWREKQNEARRENRLIFSKNCRRTDIVKGRLVHDAKKGTASRALKKNWFEDLM